MSFSAEAFATIAPIFEGCVAQPFNQELAAGTLSRERFVFYMIQDAHYLIEFGRALAVAAARAPDPDALITFAGSGREAVVVERALHEGFFQKFGVTPERVAATEPSPTCTGYTNFLLAAAHNASYEVAVAALLPCFRVYEEVGRRLLAVAAHDNPYQAWIDTYADEAFAEGVRRAEAIGDALAAATPQRARAMHAAYRRAAQYEWMFWDSAYRMEAWPVEDPARDPAAGARRGYAAKAT